MISVERAKQLILKNSGKNPTASVPLREALGCVLSKNIRASVDLPHWDNSAMDGFAINSQDTKLASPNRPILLRITATAQAGSGKDFLLKKKQAIRIMTGARIPKNANAILIKEDAVILGDSLKICTPLKAGGHIRRKGEEVKKGDLFKFKGKILNAGLIGFLASLGRDKVEVYAKPCVAIISTGDELTAPGKRLAPGKIYNSNSIMIHAALNEIGILPVSVRTVADKPGLLRQYLSSALNAADILILTGGVSAGEYDFCKEILSDLGVKTIFWKVSQKPGKPLFFGRRKNQLIFGLPGNPASVHMCFYEYALAAIRCKMGFENPFLSRVPGFSVSGIKKDRTKTLFMKGRLIHSGPKRQIEVLSRQASHMISSLYETDGFVFVPPGNDKISKGKKVFFDKLPFSPRGEFCES